MNTAVHCFESVIEIQCAAACLYSATDAGHATALIDLVFMQLLVDQIVKGDFTAPDRFGRGFIKSCKPASGITSGARQFEFYDLAGFAIQCRGISRRTRHDQFIAINNQIALWSQTANGFRIVRLLAEHVAQPVIPPDNVTRLNIHRVDENAFERPNACREIHFPIGNHGATSNRPH